MCTDLLLSYGLSHPILFSDSISLILFLKVSQMAPQPLSVVLGFAISEESSVCDIAQKFTTLLST